MAEPTSSLTFGDLLIRVAEKVGFAFYGENGDEAAQIPQNVNDLAKCKQIVNDAIRMFLADAPEEGWRFSRPVGSVTLWPSIDADEDNLITSTGYDPLTDKTTLVAEEDSFYASMEGHVIGIELVADTFTEFTVTNYVNATTIKVSGNASAAGVVGKEWEMEADGNYTMPRDFGGEFEGKVSYAAGSDRGVQVEWVDEAVVRGWKENESLSSGDPFVAAIRPKTDLIDSRRRWEVIVYPTTFDLLVIEFPYILHFDKLVDADEYLPVPFGHEEALKAACLAVCEKDVEGVLGNDWNTYKGSALAGSVRVNNRAAPKKLGYFGNPQRWDARSYRDYVRSRPEVVPDNT